MASPATAISRSRPTRLVCTPARPRPSRPWRGRTAGWARTGLALPLSVHLATAPHSNSGSVTRWVAAPTSTVPGSAAACSRAAG